jgi:acetyl-CoA C-acetyltransferase
MAHGLERPSDVYPIFENALRARLGLDLGSHRARVGRLFSRFTEVAAENPHAWFPVRRSPEELTEPSPRNRMIAFPYTKYLNAVLDTDQAAALVVCSAAQARSLGIPEKRWVHWWGGAEATEEAWYASERPDFAACPAMLDSVEHALRRAGVGFDEIDLIDFYSCFPVAVEMACHMSGLDVDDSRGFTVTGGLPYAGGPASGYTLHSLATMTERLREGPERRGLVTGNGWYLTKHAASVWSNAERPGDAPDPRHTASPVSEHPRSPVPVVDRAGGTGHVEAYTVVYDREGAPARGIVLGRDSQQRRFIANTPDDRNLLENFVAVEEVGREGSLRFDGERNRFDPR